VKQLILNGDLAAAHRGDRDALGRVIAHSRPELRRYAAFHCTARNVEDAVQESLIAIARNLHNLRKLECYPAWALRIVKRECNRQLRTQDGRATSLPDDAMLPAVYAERLEWRHDLTAALKSLPAHYRRVLVLRDVEGLSIADIAEHLALHGQAVKSRLHRARAMAREYLLR
jgi:RNA polymerase sigma factor (sigma-70 family)